MASFSTDVKNELARIPAERACCRTAELAALLRMGASVSIGLKRTLGINFITENAAVARRVLMLLKEEQELPTRISMSRSKKLRKRNSYEVKVLPSAATEKLLDRLGMRTGMGFDASRDTAILRRACCRASYLRGAFLGGGSVNRPEAGCHLELFTGSYSFGNLLTGILRKMSFPTGFTDRKNGYIVYLKEGDAILDFLAMTGAENAVERFEVARNVKEVRSQVNRLVNCETANLQKTVDAAGRQIANIKKILQVKALEELPENLREVAEVRLEYPEASLAELGKLLHLGKSGINHRLIKLEKLAAEL